MGHYQLANSLLWQTFGYHNREAVGAVRHAVELHQSLSTGDSDVIVNAIQNTLRNR